MPVDPRHREIQASFRAQFAAAIALRNFARVNRPSGSPTEDEAARLVMATYARASKTFQASLRLSQQGYGAQAGMLNRSLFEDMVVAHWIRLNAKEAPVQFERHRQHTLDDIKGKYAKYDREHEVAAWPALTDEERAALVSEYGRTPHWTKKSLYELVKEVESEWPSEVDRRILWQVFDIAHRFNNLLLHHSFFGLGLAADPIPGGVRWDVGPSDKHIHGALMVAWFSYVHLVSLVVSGNVHEELAALYTEDLPAFSHTRLADASS
jgi:hypothetical protein